MKIIKKSQKSLSEAADALKKGEVVICPTDTIYGFLADAENEKAVEKIYKIKKRAKSKPLPVFVKDIKMAKDLAEISPVQEKIIKKRWPGKYTFVLGKKGGGAVALRMPNHKFLLDLIKKIKKPLAQTSVNISGEPELNKIKDIINKFQEEDILVIDAGDLPKRKPSAIIDLTQEKAKVLRK